MLRFNDAVTAGRTVCKSMRAAAKKALCNEAGISFVESIVALMILAIGVLGVATLSDVTVAQGRRAYDLTNATLAAQVVLDRLHTTPFDSLPLGNYQEEVSMGDWTYSVFYEITQPQDSLPVGAAGTEVKRIVMYSGSGRTQQYGEAFETYIYRPQGL